MILFDKVTKKFGDIFALKKISLPVKKGEFVFVVGPSGSGKTTLLRLLLREFLPDEGRILVEKDDISQISEKKIPFLRRKIGAVFQDFKLLLDRTVFENIGLSLQIHGKKDEEIKEDIDEVISLVGLQGKEDLFPLQLSGGELQRVVIARALAPKPLILFADEPTGNLDLETGWQIVNLLKEINKKGTTVVMATHNAEIVNSLKERVVLLKKGEIIDDNEKGGYKDL